MDELKKNDAVPTIPYDVIIKVPVSGAYYAQMQNVFYALIGEKMKEDPTGFKVNKLLKELETREAENIWELQVTTYLGFIYAAEEAAKEQGLILERDIKDFINANSSEEASPES